MGILLASRKSDLARLQAYQVGQELAKKFPSEEIKYHFRESLGDINQDDPLWKMPEKGVFTEDFRQGLIDGTWDMVVHSWKDLPVDQEEGTEIVATMPRADVRDLFLFKKNELEKVKQSQSLKVFSSSPRRIYNLTSFFKDYFPGGLKEVEFESVRGNILTRIRKLIESSDTHGLIVAKAAIDRLLQVEGDEFHEGKELLKKYLQECQWQILPLSLNPTAAAQGALAVEVASHRNDIKEKLKEIHCEDTWTAVVAERKILKSYGGGCHQKIGVTQLKRKYGDLTFLRGETDGGEVLNSLSFTSEPFSISSEEAEPLNWFERKEVEYQLPDVNAHFIARANALPENFKIAPDEICWVSGLKSWRKMAQRGYWVHGSFESLGESENMRLEQLGPSLKWGKWTHNKSQSSSWAENIGTYELVPVADKPVLGSRKSFYWMSASSFQEALKLHPEIAHQAHYCGPGNTFVLISKMLEEFHNKPKIVLSYEHWKSHLKKD